MIYDMIRISCKPQSRHPPPDGNGTCIIHKQALKYRINIHTFNCFSN